MLAWACASGMILLTLLGWVSVRRAAHAHHAPLPKFLPIDVPLTIGIALGVLGSSTRAETGPWIAGAGPMSIPIAAGAVGVGWALIRNDTEAFRLRLGDAIAIAVSWIVLAGALLSGGLGLPESAAIVLGLAAWSVLGAPSGSASPRSGTRPGAIWAFWGIALAGLAGLLLGLPAAVPWAIAWGAAVLLGATPGPNDGAHRLSASIGLAVVAPLAGLSMASATRIVMGAAASGDSLSRMGGPWLMGFAQSLAARPTAALPAGFAPEMCLIGATLGVGICASKLPRRAQQVLGSVLAVAGLGTAVLALIS